MVKQPRARISGNSAVLQQYARLWLVHIEGTICLSEFGIPMNNTKNTLKNSLPLPSLYFSKAAIGLYLI